MGRLVRGAAFVACVASVCCKDARRHGRNSEISIQLRQVSAQELEVMLRNPTPSAHTIHHLHLGLDQHDGTHLGHCCWAELTPESKSLLAGEEYRFTAIPARMEWCRERDAKGSCIFRPLLEVAKPGDYIAQVYQHKDSADDPTSNRIPFRVVAVR